MRRQTYSYSARLDEVLQLCAERPRTAEEIAEHFGVSVAGVEVYILSLATTVVP